jgi:peptidoglycan/LPS O-acetylase OafA/YrhL
VGSEFYLPHWLSLFVMGMLCFQKHSKVIATAEFCLSLIAALGCALLALGTSVAVVGLGAALIIAFRPFTVWPLLFLGQISYSLYLMHVPIGGRIINLGARFAASQSERAVVLLVALSCSLLAGYLLYRLVEVPSQKWASRISYRADSADPSRSSWVNMLARTTFSRCGWPRQ